MLDRLKRLTAMAVACVLLSAVAPFSSSAVASVKHAASQPRAAAGPCTAKTPGFNQCQVFRFTGSAATLTVPAGTPAVRFHVWGASGQSGQAAPGAGGYAAGTVQTGAAQKYTIKVGGSNGFNFGVASAQVPGTTRSVGASGGRSEVDNAAGTPILVAGGGGGVSNFSGPLNGNGGAGGGANGADGTVNGTSADATAGGGAVGGTGGGGTSKGADAPNGQGGQGTAKANVPAGPGGGGWAGGGGGTAGTAGTSGSGPGGGGGSGHIDTSAVTDSTSAQGTGNQAGGQSDPFYDTDKYGTNGQAGAVVAEWSITPVKILAPKNGDTIGPNSSTFSGTGLPGSTVTLTVGGSTVGTATVATDGTWAIPAQGQATGTNVAYTATQTSAGNLPVTDSVSVAVVPTGTINGKPLKIDADPVGGCAVQFDGVDQLVPLANNSRCNTAIFVGGVKWASGFIGSGTAPPLKSATQSVTTGAGTSADPFTMTTDYTADVLRLSQTDTYVQSENRYRTDITVTNSATAAQSGTLYRASFCNTSGSFNPTFGAVLPAAPGMGSGIACVANADGSGQARMLVPLTAGSSFSEAFLTDLQNSVDSGKAFPDTCACSQKVASAMGLSWPYVLAPGQSTTYSYYSAFRSANTKPMDSAKSVSPNQVQPGNAVTYTVKFTNPNAFSVTSFGFTDTLDSRLDYVPGSTTGTGMGEPTLSGSNATWGGQFTVAAGATFTFTFQAKAKLTATTGTATNDFSGNGLTALSKVAPLKIGPLAELAVTKSVDKPSVLTGGQAVFTLTVQNTGPNPAANVVLTDLLPTGLTWVSDDSGGKYNRTTGLWTVGAIPVNGTATLKVTVKGTTEGTFLNAVTALTSDTTYNNTLCTDSAQPSTCPSATLVVYSSDLVMTAKAVPAPVAPGGTSVATLTVTNSGPSATMTAATVTFTLPQRTTLGSTLPVGCTAATDGKSVTCTVPPGLANGAKADFPISLIVDTNAPLNTALSGGSVVVASADDLKPANNTAAVPLSTTAKASNDLAMSVNAPTNPVTPGTATTVTGTVTNGGPSDTTSVSTVTFTMPGNTTAAATQPAGCTVASDKKSVACTIPLGMKNGATVSFAVSVVVDPAAPLDTVLPGGKVVVANADDPVVANNSAAFPLKTTALGTADLSVAKIGFSAVEANAASYVYTVVVSNAGPSAATAVRVTDTVPAAFTNVSWSCAATGTGSRCVTSSGTGNAIATTADLGVNGTVTYTITVKPSATAVGTTVTNTAEIVAPGVVDPTPDDHRASVDTRITPAMTCRSGYDLCINTAGPPKREVLLTSTGAFDSWVNDAKQFYSPGANSLVIDGDRYGSRSPDKTSTLIDRVPMTGSGTAADPFLISQTWQAGSTGITYKLTDTYANGQQQSRQRYEFQNSGTTPKTLRFYHAADCFLAGVDSGFSAVAQLSNGGWAPACIGTGGAAGQVEQFIPVTPGNEYYVGEHGGEFTGIDNKTALQNKVVRGNENIDNGLAIAWLITVPAGGSQTIDMSTLITEPGVPRLQLTASVSPTTAPELSGTVVTYTVNAAATTSLEVTPDQLKFTLPAGFSYVPGSMSGDLAAAPTASGQDLTWTKPFTVPGDGTKTFTFQALIATTTAPGTYIGTATGTFGTYLVGPPKGQPDAHKATVTVTAIPKADLAITKKPATTTPVAPGDSFDYTITVTNNGPSDATAVSVTDALPAALRFVSASDGCTAVGQNVSCPKLATLVVKASKTYTIKVQLDPSYTGDGSDVKNQAKVTSDTFDPNLANNTSDASTGGLPGPGPGPNPPAPVKADVAITKKAASTTPVAAGESFDYTVTVTNNGPSDAKGLQVTDALPTMLKFVSASDSCTATGQNVTCPKLATLAAGASKVYTITVRLDSAYAGDGSDVKNQAKVATDTADPNPANNTSDASTGGLPGPGPGPNPPAKPSADLSITKKAEGTASVTPGQSFIYGITVANAGPSQAKNVTVTDVLPAGLIFKPSAGCTASGQTVTCGPVATLAVGQTQVFKVTVQLDPAYAGDGSDIKNQASVKSDTADPNMANNTSDAASGGLPGPGPGPNPPTPPSADLSITKKAEGTAPVVPGGNVVYAIVVANAGPSQAKNVVVTDALPAALKFVSSDAGCTASAQSVTCGPVPTLDAGATKTVRITVRLDPAYSGDGSDIRNQASVKSDTADPNLANNTSDATTGGLPGPNPGPNPPTKPSADLSITKKAEGTTAVAPGQSFIYDLTVTNSGPSQAKNVVVTDALPSMLTFQPSEGCTASGQTVTCGPLATLDAGKTQVFKVTVQLAPAYAGDGSDIKNQASVKSDTADPNMVNNTSDAATGGLPGPGPGPNPPLKASADLSITKKAEGTAAVAPGQSFIYDITVANAGPSQAKNVTVTDALPEGLLFKPSAGCTAVGQVVTCGPLATLDVGKTQLYKVTVQLDPAYAGDGSDIRNQASVKSDTADPDMVNNTSDASTGGLPGPGPGPNPPLKPSADLSITKKAEGTAPVVPGGNVVYAIVVANAGPSQAKNVVVTDALPAALKFVSSDAGCTASGQSVTCGPVATLDVGATMTVKITVQLDPAYSGDGSDIRNQASVKSDTADPDMANNTSDASTGGLPGPNPGPNPPTKPSADLSITKKAEGATAVAPGQSFIYDLTVTGSCQRDQGRLSELMLC